MGNLGEALYTQRVICVVHQFCLLMIILCVIIQNTPMQFVKCHLHGQNFAALHNALNLAANSVGVVKKTAAYPIQSTIYIIS